MRVTSVDQQNNISASGMLRAGVMGGVMGAIVRNVAPLTAEEDAMFFNSAAKTAIKEKVSKVRANEVAKIAQEISDGTINVSKGAGDIFVKNKDIIANSSKKAEKIIGGAQDSIKEGLTSLISRVDMVGTAKEHIETNNIKTAAKSARPLAYFVGVGALIAMSGKMIVDAFNTIKSETAPQEKKKHDVTMADVLLEGLGSNAEVLFLTNEANNKK